MSDQNKARVLKEIDKEWDRLMKVAQWIDFGRAEIVFQNGKPIRVEIPVKQIKLDGEEEPEEVLKIIPLL